MAIYAQKSGGGSGQSGGLRVQIGKTVQDGAILVWDASVGAFVDTVASGAAITGGRTLGGEAAINVLKGRAGTSLEFRGLRAGPGVSLHQDAAEIIISSDASDALPSVAGSYRIVIDSDDSTDDEARLELFTVRAAAERVGIATTNLPVLISSAVHTGNLGSTGTQRGFFEIRDEADFASHGFRAGMWVKVGHALNQSGTYRIEQVLTHNVSGISLSTLVIDEPFFGTTAFNMGGPKPSVTFEQIDVVILTDEGLAAPHDPDQAYCVSCHSIDFGPAGMDFRPGMVVQVSGTADQDGSYLIEAVEPRDATGYSTLVMAASTPFAGTVGPQSGRIEFRVQQSEVDTGFSVSERGNLLAATGTFATGVSITDPAYRPTAPGDVVTRASLDRATGRKPLRYFFAQL